METLNSHKDRVQWRRSKVMELSSQGNSQTAISQTLRVGLGTVNRDIQYLREQSKASIQQYSEQLPHEYEKCLIALTEILKESFDISHEPQIERREKLQCMSLIKEIISTKLDLLTNATIVKDAMALVEKYGHKINIQKQKYEKQNSISTNKEEEEDVTEDNNEELDDVEIQTTDDQVF